MLRDNGVAWWRHRRGCSHIQTHAIHPEDRRKDEQGSDQSRGLGVPADGRAGRPATPIALPRGAGRTYVFKPDPGAAQAHEAGQEPRRSAIRSSPAPRSCPRRCSTCSGGIDTCVCD